MPGVRATLVTGSPAAIVAGDATAGFIGEADAVPSINSTGHSAAYGTACDRARSAGGRHGRACRALHRLGRASGPAAGSDLANHAGRPVLGGVRLCSRTGQADRLAGGIDAGSARAVAGEICPAAGDRAARRRLSDSHRRRCAAAQPRPDHRLRRDFAAHRGACRPDPAADPYPLYPDRRQHPGHASGAASVDPDPRCRRPWLRGRHLRVSRDQHLARPAADQFGG